MLVSRICNAIITLLGASILMTKNLVHNLWSFCVLSMLLCFRFGNRSCYKWEPLLRITFQRRLLIFLQWIRMLFSRNWIANVWWALKGWIPVLLFLLLKLKAYWLTHKRSIIIIFFLLREMIIYLDLPRPIWRLRCWIPPFKLVLLDIILSPW